MALKHLHMTFAVISIVGFVIRGFLSMRGSPIMEKKWIKIAPHVNDTLLLLAGLLLMFQVSQYPFVHGWLTAKVLGLLVYIGLGVVAIRVGKTPAQKGAAWIAAIVVFVYMLSVAFTKSAWGFLG